MKTLADLKRDAKAGLISGEMVCRFGKTDIPENLKGKRKIIDANSVGVKFLNADGKKSELRISAASLVEYSDDSLTIYSPGKRELNSEEQAFMNKWKEIENTSEFQERSRIDALSDGSSTYWQKKHFFVDGGFEYLLGYEMKQGKKLDFSTGLITDNKVKGDIELQYKIYKN